MDKIEILSRLKKEKIVAVIRASSKEKGLKIVEAVVKGGIKFIEITYTVPKASQLIEALIEKYEGTDIVVGAGTCLDAETGRNALLAGAQFVVSPSYSKPLIQLCNRYRVPVMTGAQTVSEVVMTMEEGVDVIKLFPGDVYGPSVIKSIKAPLPQALLMPTGGVSVDNIKDWYANGAFAVGTGGSLTKGAEKDDYEAVTAEARRFVEKRDEFVEAQKS